MTYADVDDVAARLGRPITDADERRQVQAWLDDVELIIRAAIPDLDALVEAGEIDAQALAMVEANAVVRKVRNPDGKMQERIDDYSYGYSQDAARGDLYLTDDEWALILPHGSRGAWTIAPGHRPYGQGEWVRPDLWVPLP